MVLDQDHPMVRDAVRTFVRDAITPYAATWDRERTFPNDVHRQLAELGAYGVDLPRRARLPDLRGHERHPENFDCTRTRLKVR